MWTHKELTKETGRAVESHFEVCVSEASVRSFSLSCSIHSFSLSSTTVFFIFNIISDIIEALDNS